MKWKFNDTMYRKCSEPQRNSRISVWSQHESQEGNLNNIRTLQKELSLQGSSATIVNWDAVCSPVLVVMAWLALTSSELLRERGLLPSQSSHGGKLDKQSCATATERMTHAHCTQKIASGIIYQIAVKAI